MVLSNDFYISPDILDFYSVWTRPNNMRGHYAFLGDAPSARRRMGPIYTFTANRFANRIKKAYKSFRHRRAKKYGLQVLRRTGRYNRDQEREIMSYL